jgi:preprotein translocase subunit SecD
MMRFALLFFSLLAAMNAAQKLEVHLVVPCGHDTGNPMKDPDGAGTVCLDKTPFLTEKDVESAEIHRTSAGNSAVFLTFHIAAAQRELQVTLKNVGGRVAIVLNGALVSVLRISSGSRFLFIDGKYDHDHAAAIVEEFNKQSRR